MVVAVAVAVVVWSRWIVISLVVLATLAWVG